MLSYVGPLRSVGVVSVYKLINKVYHCEQHEEVESME